MIRVNFGDRPIELLEGETVLAGLLRSDIDTPYSCGAGVCQACMLRAEDSDLPPESQAPLTNNLREQGYFLPCVCVPRADVSILTGDLDDLYQPVTVLQKHHYNRSICRLRLEKPHNFRYHPGQFINIRCPNDKQLIRSYSLSSHPKDDYIEVQVRAKCNGNLSRWLCEDIQVSQYLDVQGPNGTCFYSGESERDLLLIGTGTGIAPLYGIVREALQQQHSGRIQLYYGSRNHVGLYLLPELLRLAEQVDNLSVVATLSGEEHEVIADDENIQAGRANELAFPQGQALSNSELYLCGNAGMVKAAQKQGFLAGVSMARIFVDPFEHKNLRQTVRDTSDEGV